MNKKIIGTLFIIIFTITITQSNALSNWIQTTIGNNWGIWSPSKNNTNESPSLTLTQDAKLGVGLKDINSLSDNNVKSGYVMAQGYCFEKTKECVSSFVQDTSNIKTFSPNFNKDIKAKNRDQSQYTPEAGKLFLFDINKDFLDNVGMDPNYGKGKYRGQQATNWFRIGYSYFNIWNESPRSLWIEQGDNFAPTRTSKYEKGRFIPGNNKQLIYCVKEINGIKKEVFGNVNDCKNSPEILYHYWCDTNSDTCGYPMIEFRLTMGSETTDENCHNYNYSSTLLTSNWGDPNILITKSLPYERVSNFTNIPDRCRLYSNTHAQIQARILIIGKYGDAQSLVSLIEKYPYFRVGIGKFGLTLLQ